MDLEDIEVCKIDLCADSPLSQGQICPNMGTSHDETKWHKLLVNINTVLGRALSVNRTDDKGLTGAAKIIDRPFAPAREEKANLRNLETRKKLCPGGRKVLRNHAATRKLLKIKVDNGDDFSYDDSSSRMSDINC